ncbi:hypothetical protein M9979_07760 [Sphingomonas sp. RP10(2022)]|uniref:Uncharacterized protein n=1 Tax=Sphingomonas liriopis TaxID=2949094 RepID=A0A9X2HWD2_9SPHN|nr:hypothetical protein [Sphingomonas liriopis]MCP3734763.1 hypothetical protein [Sphingomonas liriopis]
MTDSRIEIRMPQIDDLADHYIDYPSIRALKDAARDMAALIDATVAFGRFYTDRFHDEAYGDGVSLRELRAMIQRDYEGVQTPADERRFALN